MVKIVLLFKVNVSLDVDGGPGIIELENVTVSSPDRYELTKENFKVTLTINVYVVYLVPDKMILMRANPLQGPIPLNGPSNGFAPIKIIKSKRHVKKEVPW